MKDLTNEQLKQEIKDTEARLLALREELLARELRLAEHFLPTVTRKAHQYFGPGVTIKAEADRYDHQAMVVIEMPYYPMDEAEVRYKVEGDFYEDPEVQEILVSLFIHIRFAFP